MGLLVGAIQCLQTKGDSEMSTYLPVKQNTEWQQGESFDYAKTALLVVDVLGGSAGCTPGLEHMAENCVQLVYAARDAHIPVLFTCDAHIEGIDRELVLWGDHGIAGTESSKPLDAFNVQASDFIIPKRRYDSFFQTDLDITLRELGVDTLICVGCDTNICVMQTLAGAFYRGYKTIIAADATATFLVGTQEGGLEYFTRCFDTRVTTTQHVLDQLAEK